MNIKVAVKAFREPGEERLVVRRGVTLGTLWNCLVFGMVASRTVNLGMLALGSFPLFIYLLVAGAAGDRWRILRIGNQLRIVNRVTLCACRELLTLVVRLVAGRAFRYEAV